MKDVGIIFTYLAAGGVTTAVIVGGWVFCEVSWWVFIQIFGHVDAWLQERHWRKIHAANNLCNLKTGARFKRRTTYTVSRLT